MFDEHAEGLFSFFAYRTGNRTLAGDLLSETFERVLRSRRRLDPRLGSERRWLYTIALNLLRDSTRPNMHEEHAVPTVVAGTGADEPDTGLDMAERHDELARALSTLSDSEREAIALRFGADLELRDVARIVGEGESAVEVRIHRALAKLRDELSHT